MSEMLQHHLYKAVCGFQNVGHFASVQNLLFKHDVTNANLDVLLGQIAHIQCVHLKHSHRSFHRSPFESSFAIQLPLSARWREFRLKFRKTPEMKHSECGKQDGTRYRLTVTSGVIFYLQQFPNGV
ncbi:MAG: hypothetical protein WA532_01900 [Candidatus Korobacteraceae bacterium]